MENGSKRGFLGNWMTKLVLCLLKEAFFASTSVHFEPFVSFEIVSACG